MFRCDTMYTTIIQKGKDNNNNEIGGDFKIKLLQDEFQ